MLVPFTPSPATFTVTREWAHKHKTPNKGFTRLQVEALGHSWPPQKGWLSSSIGKQITEKQKDQFEKMRSALSL